MIKNSVYLVFFLFFLSSCENKLEDVATIGAMKNKGPVETAKDIDITYSDSAKVKARVLSPLLYHFTDIENPYYEMPNGVLINFYNTKIDTLMLESVLSAKYAIRYEKKQVMEARDSVVVINKKGEKLNTERLVWNEATQRIYSDKFVKITTKDKIIFGDGFEANQDFSKYRIFKIKGIVNIKEEAAETP